MRPACGAYVLSTIAQVVQENASGESKATKKAVQADSSRKAAAKLRKDLAKGEEQLQKIGQQIDAQSQALKVNESAALRNLLMLCRASLCHTLLWPSITSARAGSGGSGPGDPADKGGCQVQAAGQVRVHDCQPRRLQAQADRGQVALTRSLRDWSHPKAEVTELQVGIIRNVEVELQAAARDVQEATKTEQDKMHGCGS